MPNNNLLLVCADPLESRLLALALEQAGLAVTAVAGPESAGPPQPDLIVLVNHDGRYLAAVQTLRQRTGALLLLLADYQSEDDHIAALRAGVDLILFRPYSIRFLAAQLPALLRRFTKAAAATPPDPASGRLRGLVSGIFRLNTQTQTLHVAGGEPTHLSHLEFRLLQVLMSHPRQVIPTETLIELVYGHDSDGDDQLVRKLICRLRAKLKDDGREPRFIHTVPGVGYRFHDEGERRQPGHAPAQPDAKIETGLGQLLGQV